MDWRQLISNKRFGLEELHEQRKDDRSEFQRDYDRLVFSAPFRRLQNKTQVFPLPGSVFVHNRLTHSLEVSCVGRSIGNNIAKEVMQRHPELLQACPNLSEVGAIVSAACLAHDLGNPPFGHSGERAIGTYFSEGKGQTLHAKLSPAEWSDITHFEGNANTFRLLTHQFIGRRRGGFVMTYSTLASIVKYPYASPLAGEKGKFGFFCSESDSFVKIANELGLKRLSSEGEPLRYARHPLVYAVEAADDICYEIMDIEDAHKLKILTTDETKELLLQYFTPGERDRAIKVFKMVSDVNEQIAYLRSGAIGALIKACTRAFMDYEAEILAGTFEGSLIEHVAAPIHAAYRHCESVSYKKIYHSKDVVDIELAGFKVMSTLVDIMIDAVLSPDKAYSQLLMRRVSEQYDMLAPTLYGKVQAVLDYVSGMTDVFAVDLYRKINGTSLPAV